MVKVTDEVVLCGRGCVLECDACGAGLTVVPMIREGWLAIRFREEQRATYPFSLTP